MSRNEPATTIFEPPQRIEPSHLSVIGIGASAGCLTALRDLFAALPHHSGLTFVVVVHLSPEHESILADLLQPYTNMPVIQVQGRIEMEPDHVYVIPPAKQLIVTDNALNLTDYDRAGHRPMQIDSFFRSLAENHGDGGAVILSGSGSDGAVGIQAIKEKGGLIFVQAPDEAEYDSMPRSAIATGLVDVVAPVAVLAVQLVAAKQTHPSLQLPADGEALAEPVQQTLGQILSQLRLRTGHDFSGYKPATLVRRLMRRMQLTQLTTLTAYLQHLRQDSDEVEALFRDLLINVTAFFRDKEAWAALESSVIPRLFAGKGRDDTVRVWTVGCATGEEAYSIAALLLTYASDLVAPPAIQIFASDLSKPALDFAREGCYPEAIADDVREGQLARFFTKENNHYRARPELREVILFTQHNLLQDPPFSKLDLILCRNLLIYIQRDLQEQIFETFYYALRPQGRLFLGNAESAEGATDLFETVDKRHRLYQRRVRISSAPPILPTLPLLPYSSRRTVARTETARRVQPTVEQEHQLLLETAAPPSILVDRDHNTLHLSETAGRFLLPPGGAPTTDLLKLVRPELQAELRVALFRAFDEGKAIVSKPVPVQFNGAPHRVYLLVRPHQPGEGEQRALVIFLEDETALTVEAAANSRLADTAAQQQAAAELRQVQERLQSMREEYETTVEELRAANEELQSTNEEYKSTLEELETSKEELQSMNEELQTINQELKNKVEEVTQTNNDLQNLFAATDIATLFLDRELRVKRYTPRTVDLFNLMPPDKGRPITHLRTNLRYDQLDADARAVLTSLTMVEREVQSRDERWFLIRMRPYRTLEDKIDGVVITFVDITVNKQTAARLQRSAALDALRVALDDALRPLTAPVEIQATAARVLGEHLGANQVHYGETLGDYVYISQGYGNGLPPMVGRFRFMDFGERLIAGYRQGHTQVSHDIDHDPTITAAERAVIASAGFHAYIAVPLMKEGEWIATLAVHSAAPRNWTDDEIEIVEEVAERTWAAVERARAEAALRVSEARHRTLFDSIDEGACLFERLPLRPDGHRDYYYLAMNPAMQAMFDIADLSGQSVRDNFPDEAEGWYDDFDRVLTTGQPSRFERKFSSLGMVLEMFVTRLEDGSGQRLLAVMQDVTERKRHEANLAFLAEISEDLVRLTNLEETMAQLGAKIGHFFDVKQCMFAEHADEFETLIISYGWHAEGAPDLRQTYRLRDFMADELIRALLTGEPLRVSDTQTDGRVNAENCGTLGIRAFIIVPLSRQDAWQFQISIIDNKPRTWREDEVDLMREITARIWTRLERARAEEALRRSEEKYRTLFNSIDEGFCIIERVAGEPLDFRYLEANPAFAVQSGVQNVIGKTIRQVVPGEPEEWFAIYDRVLQTRAPIRFERALVSVGRVLELYAFPVADQSDNRLAVIFDDITERKRREADLAFLTEVSTDFGPLASAEELMQTLGARLARHLRLSRCDFSVVDEPSDRITTLYDWRADEALPSVLGEHQISSFLNAAGRQTLAAGNISVINDVRQSSLMNASAETMQALGIGAVVDTPYLEDGRWCFLLSVCRAEATAWREDEIELIRELTTRIYIRLERVRAEEALRQSEERFRTLVAKGADMITISDPTGKIVYASPTTLRVTGYTPEEFMQQHPFASIHPDDRPLCEEAMQQLAATSGLTLELQHRFLHKDGTWHWLEGAFTSLYHDPAIGGVVANVRDITERKAAEAALQSLNATLEQRIDMRTTQVRALASELTRAEQGERRRISQVLHDDLQQLLYGMQMRMMAMHNDIAAGNTTMLAEYAQEVFQWMGDAIQITRRLTVDLSPPVLKHEGLVDTIRWLVTQMATVNGLRVELHATDIIYIADEDMRVLLFQSVRELLFNVVKHAATDHVAVALQETATGEVMITIRDEGRGFDIAAAAAAKDSGGYGLFSVRERLKLFGGRMDIQATPGQGTTITLYVPIGDRTQAAGVPPAGPSG